MEEISNKLNSGGPTTVSQIISKLVQIIKSKQVNDILEVPEFRFLREKCISNNSAVNVVAAEGVLSIARTGDHSLVKSILTDLITVITTTRCSSNVTFLINNLLLIDLQKELSTNQCYKAVYNLRLPQHPFIIMLNEDPSCWSLIFQEIVYSYKTATESAIPHYDKLYRPVFLYILCNPDINQLFAFRQKLWTFLIQKEAAFEGSEFIKDLISWMQLEARGPIQTNSGFLMELSELNSHKVILDPDLLLLWQVSALHQLILNNYDPRTMIFNIFSSLQNVENPIILNPILVTLAKCVSCCTSVHVLQLLKLCKFVLSESSPDAITRNILKAPLLQWITNPSDLIPDATEYANKLFFVLQTPEIKMRQKGFLEFFKKHQKIIATNTEVYFSLQLFTLLEIWKSEDDIIKWLLRLQKAPTFFTIKLFDFLTGLFLTEFSQLEITKLVFGLILRCVDFNKNLAPNVLTVILFKITHATDSDLHYRLLKAVPQMAVNKNNYQKVVSTIQALNKGRGTLKTFSTTLMMDVWKIDNKYYQYLENFLIAPYQGDGNKWEFFVTKAHVLKELCAMKPELYGKEIVAHLSKILNECNNPDGALASALAIEGITFLCKSEIIDAVTTWATLEPMFKNENRVQVIKSLCVFFSEIPTLSYSDAYPKLISDVVSKLWEYLTLNSSDDVWKAALTALTHFSVEQIVAQTPEEYLDEEMLIIRKGGHVVPGKCWLHFLKNCTESKLKIAGDFLIKLTSLEVSGYLKFVYQVKGTREPVDYSYLPVNSVVRGLSTYIKSQVLKWKTSEFKEIYLECLRVFSQEYSKPLPPLDWCFLQELFHEPRAKQFCVDIAAHQVVLSGTARRFIVNYIEALTQDYANEDVLLIYRNLKHLANSVQPFTLKPFLEVTISNAVDLFDTGNDKLLLNIVEHVKDTLKNHDIQEANKVVIAQILTAIFNDIYISSKLFPILLDCVVLFPMKCINDVSSPKAVKEVGTEWFKKAVMVRCSLAVNCDSAPLNLLNDLMESASSFPTLIPFLFEQFATVFETHKDNTECVLWVLELIGQIQAVTAEKSEEKEILFLCNIFILATVVFSGHSVFVHTFSNCEDMYRVFPRAIATLLDVNHWSICTTQALEWFHHMNNEKMFHKEYNDMFMQCLQTLRHESEFFKNMKWTKYLNVGC